jgi:hypothetical protein
MDLYTRLLRHSEENSEGEVCLKIITTGKPNASYSVSRLNSSDIKKQEWLKHNGVFDDLKINLTGEILSPPLLEGINYSINISSPEPSDPIKYKTESALGSGCKSGENGLRFDIRLNRNIVKNIIDTLVWKDTLFRVNKFQDDKINDESEIGTSFNLVVNNIKKFEDESELNYQIRFTVESLEF